MVNTPAERLTEMAIEAGLTAEFFDDDVHTVKGREAARINNDGIEEQIKFLVAECGVQWVEEMLEAGGVNFNE